MVQRVEYSERHLPATGRAEANRARSKTSNCATFLPQKRSRTDSKETLDADSRPLAILGLLREGAQLLSLISVGEIEVYRRIGEKTLENFRGRALEEL